MGDIGQAMDRLRTIEHQHKTYATNTQRRIRQLEKENRLLIRQLELAKDRISILKLKKGVIENPSIFDVILDVAQEVTGVPIFRIKKGGGRRKDIISVRHIVVGVMHERYKGPLLNIATALDYTDHSTVIHALGNFSDFLDVPKMYQYENEIYNSISALVDERLQAAKGSRV